MYDMPSLKYDYIKWDTMSSIRYEVGYDITKIITKYDYVTSWGMFTNSKNKNKIK